MSAKSGSNKRNGSTRARLSSLSTTSFKRQSKSPVSVRKLTLRSKRSKNYLKSLVASNNKIKTCRKSRRQRGLKRRRKSRL